MATTSHFSVDGTFLPKIQQLFRSYISLDNIVNILSPGSKYVVFRFHEWVAARATSVGMAADAIPTLIFALFNIRSILAGYYLNETESLLIKLN